MPKLVTRIKIFTDAGAVVNSATREGAIAAASE